MGDCLSAGTFSLKEAKIAIIGLGHVGLPTALGLAELGWNVIGTDNDPAKIEVLQAGEPHFYEPDLKRLLGKHLEGGNLKLMADVEAAIRSASVLILCVGTPQAENGEADLRQVEEISRIIARNLNGYKLIVEKSTVPAKTSWWVKKTIERYGQATKPSNGNGTQTSTTPDELASDSSPLFEVASNPEFLQEGKALENFFRPDRVVIGVESERARQILEEMYRPLHCRILVTNLVTAELIKHTANAFLATKISFINMVADICEPLGADVTQVAAGLGLDPRIGPQFLSAGIGFGGYCLPKDLQAFIHLMDLHGVEGSLLKEVQRINERRATQLLNKLRQALWILQGKTIGILGLAFKGGTDDIREAPSLRIISALLKEGARLQLYDPKAMDSFRSFFSENAGALHYAGSAYEAARGAHALLLVTDWNEFLELDFGRLRDLMEVPVVVDGRNLFDPHEMGGLGFQYFSIGRDGAADGSSVQPESSERLESRWLDARA